MELNVAAGLLAHCRGNPGRSVWLDHLPDLVGEIAKRWSLALEPLSNSEEASCSYVASATCPDGTRAILKIAMPHMEGQQEIQGLRFWGGDPTVKLLMADEKLGALLLERCQPGTPLRARAEPEQDVVIARLLRRLWRTPPAGHIFRPLAALTQYWSAETLAQAGRWPDPGLVREGLRLFSQLPNTGTAEVVLATDLHAGNVLRAEREEWLVIDPKPFAGDPAFDATQHLFNCPERLRSDPGGTISRFADLLGVDQTRVRLWAFARAAAEPRDDWADNDLMTLARILDPA